MLAAAMSSASSMSIKDLGELAGAGSDITEYLELRGIRTAPTLALMAVDEDGVRRNLVQPLLNGFEKGGVKIQIEESEKPIASAVILHMWNEAKLLWAQRQQSLSSCPAPFTATGLAAAPATGPSAAAGSTEKIPKSLPPNVWSDQVNKYNNITLNGKKRRFPEEELLGAESILARIHFEHTKSRMYTPVALGEILSRRSFTATGDINPLAKNPKRQGVLAIDGDQLVQEDERQWSPRSILAIMDGIQSVMWAFILLEVGEEDSLHTFGKWCIAKVRSRPNKLENFKQWWDAASWKIAMKMRAGNTFTEAAAEVMADLDLFNEHMSREIVNKDPSTSASRTPAPSRKRVSSREGDEDSGRYAPRPRQGTPGGKGGKGSGKRAGREASSWSAPWPGNKWSSSWHDKRPQWPSQEKDADRSDNR